MSGVGSSSGVYLWFMWLSESDCSLWTEAKYLQISFALCTGDVESPGVDLGFSVDRPILKSRSRLLLSDSWSFALWLHLANRSLHLTHCLSAPHALSQCTSRTVSVHLTHCLSAPHALSQTGRSVWALQPP
eukprot:GHVN01075964.1.p2 GENE.GHVN01075964.1~~GHVN01075964.1.p2  ORF type:complete len:131 (+),score=13.15 GHVN01075964.1:429-821(+)